MSDDDVYRALLRALRPWPVPLRTEPGPPTPVSLPCPACGADPVHYSHTVVLEGDLDWHHLVHTEVEHRCVCACGHRFGAWAIL